MSEQCSIDRCPRKSHGRGWCKKHYQRWSRNGDVLWEPLSIEERFWKKVNKTDTCWLWTGAITGAGYGHLYIDYKDVYAHRLAYEFLVGPIPEGLVLDHLCRVHNCVRPDHLEPVTDKENLARGEATLFQTSKTHCPQGHEYAGENLYLSSTNRRYCRTCQNVNQKRRRQIASTKENNV
jgi:hypothetical protein